MQKAGFFTTWLILGSAKIAVWPSFGKELLTRYTIFSLYIMFVCDFSDLRKFLYLFLVIATDRSKAVLLTWFSVLLVLVSMSVPTPCLDDLS